MNKILPLFIAVLATVSMFAQSQRTVLMEEFTQASCPPCEATTPSLNAIMDANAADVVQIRYNTSWPGVDPMNADNPTEIRARVDYYGVSGVPNFNLDGVTNGSTVPNQNQINGFINASAPVLVEVDHALSADLLTMDVTVRVTNEGTTDFSLSNDFLRVALVEELVAWPFEPGSTSIVDFEYVFKTFFTTPEGMAMPDVAAGQTWEMTWTDLQMPERIYDYQTLAVVAFIQQDNSATSHPVLNAAKSEPIVLTGYASYAVSAGASVDGGLCDPAFSPSATVINNGSADLTGVVVNFVNNGDVVESITVTDVIPAGGSLQVNFATVDLPNGQNDIIYTLESGTAGQDLAILDNFTEVQTYAKAGAIVNDFEKGFETQTVPALPVGAVVDIPTSIFVVNSTVLNATNPLGGYGQSENSARVNFYQWTNDGSLPLTGNMIIAEQVEVVSESPIFSFDWAFTTWGGSNDGLAVEISTDCGVTYSEIWKKTGSALATAPEINNPMGAFVPNATQWDSADIDLSAYLGEKVLLRFFFTTGWGDMLYLDNINVQGISAIDELDQDESISLYPNPATSEITLDMNLNEVSDVNIRMVNIMGQTVLVDKMNGVSGNSQSTIDVSGLPTGAYVLYMNVGEKEVVRRISVAK